MRIFDLTRWPSILVFLFAGTIGATFALITLNLFTQAAASLRFLREYGAEAVMHGALLQIRDLIFWGALSLLCWVAFKISEHELVNRYFAWSRRRKMSATNIASPPMPESDTKS